MLEAAINGARSAQEHNRLPITTSEMAHEAREVIEAGADTIHFHVKDARGHESLDPTQVAEQVTAVRQATPTTPIGISTGAWIVPDVRQRLDLIRRWEVLPDFVSVNFDEEGALEVAQLVLEKDIGIEAGVSTREAADIFVRSNLSPYCLRILLEPAEQQLAKAEQTIEAIISRLQNARIDTPRLLHGFEATAWRVLHTAHRLGYDTRIGLEDILTLPNGEFAPSNAALVRAALSISQQLKNE